MNDKESAQENLGYKDPADMFMDPAEQRAQDDEQWVQMFRKGIQFIEETKGVKYDEAQIKNFAILLHGKIPPLRFFKICKVILTMKSYRKLPQVEDFLDLHEGEHKISYVAPGSYYEEPVCDRHCYKGKLDVQAIYGISEKAWRDYSVEGNPQIGMIKYMDCHTVMVSCDCAIARHHSGELKAGWLLRALDKREIGYTVEEGVFYSERYPGRKLRIRLKKDVEIPDVPPVPLLVELNAEDTSRLGDRTKFVNLDDGYSFPLKHLHWARKRESDPVVNITF